MSVKTDLHNLDYDFYDKPMLCSRELGWNDFVVQQFSVRNALITDWFELDQNMLVLSLSGQVRLESKSTAATSIEISSGRSAVYTAPANLAMRYVVKQVPRDVVFVRFDPRFIADIAHQSKNFAALKFPLTSTYLDETSSGLVHLLVEELKNRSVNGRLYAESIGTALASHLLVQLSHGGSNFNTASEAGLSPQKLHQLIDYIDSHLSQDLSLVDMAHEVGLSVFHFCRMFKQSVGVSPHQYVLERRVERAKRLLRATDISISEIAYAVGCQNQSQFSQMFRKCVGASPKQFRESLS